MTPIAMTVTPVVTALASATLKATTLLAMTALLARAFRHRAAALRHLIWTVALGAAVTLLVLPTVLPAWRVVPVAISSPAAVRQYMSDVARLPATSIAASPAQTRQGVNANAAPVAASRPTAGSIRVSWATVALTLWLSGVLAIVARYTWSRITLERMSRRSTILDDRSAMDAQVVREMQIARPVCIRASDDVDLPLTWGIVHPQIVLPADAVEWTAECRRHVLQHELAHIRRLDAATQLVAQAASALFWFNPLVWFAVAQMRRERERACDDCVLAAGAVASDYASDLLSLVTSHGYAGRHAVALAIARRSHFEGRLLALLDPTIDRRFLSSRGVVLTVGVGLAFVAPLAAMRTAAARPTRAEHAQPAQTMPQQTPAGSASQTIAPSTTTTSARRPERTTTAVATTAVQLASLPAERHEESQTEAPAHPMQQLQDVFASCRQVSMNGESHHDSESSDNGGHYWTASGAFGGCSFDLKSEGDVVLSADATTIERIASGGYLEASTNIHGEITRFSARGSLDGAPVYALAKSGSRAGEQMASGIWLAQFLIGLDRTTAFAAERRFPILLQSGGPSLVLSEIEQMYTVHAKYVYGERLLRTAKLDAVSLRRMAAVVTSINTDHSAGELLVAIADHYPLTDPAVRSALLATALTMSVTHEQARSLISIVGNSPLSATEAVAVLESVKKMTVDVEKMFVLRAVASSQRLDGDGRAAFTAAVETIREPHLRERLMGALR
jgi:beta-lactamase regulating signal transducer with metallopeptidase domain